jgi:tripartite ATP-independent transporter DctP family solute receptor
MILGAILFTTGSAFADQPVKKIRWVLAHEPVRLFEAAAKNFAKEVKEKTGGKLEVEVMTVPEYSKKYAKGADLKHMDVIHYIQDNKIEMSQTYTTSLGELQKDLYVLDLPFLFRDHAHAAKVLEGKVGGQLLASLEKNNVKGLAFTYSGGYRVIPGNVSINKLEQFKGMKIRTSNSPVAQDTFSLLGAKPVPMSLEEVANATKQGKIVAGESTYPRFYELHQNDYSKVLNDTKHSLFLTSIIMSETFWNGLTPDLQKAVREAAISSARLEREQSIADAEVTKEKCRKDGINVVELPATEVKKFEAITKPIYKKYKNYFSQDYIAQIQNN